MDDVKKKVLKAIEVLVDYDGDIDISGIKAKHLVNIVMSESAKAYLVKEVDEVNKDGFYLGYKTLCGRLADIIIEVNNEFSYPKALSSTVLEAAHNQKYFAEHLPRLFDAGDQPEKLKDFLSQLIFNLVNINKSNGIN